MSAVNQEVDPTPPKRFKRSRIFRLLIGVVLVWAVLAYLLVPLMWDGYARVDPALDDAPRITQTGDHHPGDPLNVELIGTATQLQAIMKTADWYTAAALGIESDVEIAADTILSRPDDVAPVSSLYLYGRKEDFAFEQPVGDNPRHRHHVRFWKTEKTSGDGRPTWIGSAAYDERVGISRTTGQITHVTAPDVDTERDYLFECLDKTGELASKFIEPGFHQVLSGTNGGGDPWRTDGDLYGGVIKESVE